MSESETPKLNRRELRFIDEYLVDLNAARAAEAAGYSKDNARNAGYKLLKKALITEAINKEIETRTKRLKLSQERVIRELEKVGFSNMADFVTWKDSGVALIESGTLTPEQTACVAEISETTNQYGGSVRFKLHDKIRALELLGKHLGLFSDRVADDDAGRMEFKLKYSLAGKDSHGRG